MNRFLTRKKAEPTLDDAATPPSASKRNKRSRKNKGEETLKPELDLTQALPSNDNFRTSLLMPNLSARFSVLREQVDPESKLAKAGDDSVLFPKGLARLTDATSGSIGLTDIAEVASINDSAHPPRFAGRSGSVDGGVGDADSVHSAGIMNRPRPGEGNVLFGGRQKVYLGNRAVYDDDVGLSAYQRARVEQRRRQSDQDAELNHTQEDDKEPTSPTHILKRSSSFSGSFRHRRETASSTASGPGARVSTAATSIASQGANATLPPSTTSTIGQTPERTCTKGRRLYEQGLDRNTAEANAVINRLNSLQNKQPITSGRPTPTITRPGNATASSDRMDGVDPSRPMSQDSAPSLTSTEDDVSQNSSPTAALSSPTSSFPPTSPLATDHPLASAIRPGDRGKATAMGAFNKPAQQFDEQQYLQRQKQMRRGLDTPVPRKCARSPSSAVQERLDKFELQGRDRDVNFKRTLPILNSVSDSCKHHTLRTEIDVETHDLRPACHPSEKAEERVADPPSHSQTRTSCGDRVSLACAVPASPPKQKPSHTSSPLDGSPISSVPPSQRLVSLEPIKTQVLPPRSTSPQPFVQRGQMQIEGGADLDRPGSSKDRMASLPPDSNDGDNNVNLPPSIGPLRAVDQVVSMSEECKQQGLVASRFDPSTSSSRCPEPKSLHLTHDLDSKTLVSAIVTSDPADLDSPTLGPGNGGLSVLIRQHLRPASQYSCISSVYDDDMADNSDHNRPNQLTTSSVVSDTPAHSSYSHSNPWDLEDSDGRCHGEGNSLSSVSPVDGPECRARSSSILAAPADPLHPEPGPTQRRGHDHSIPCDRDMKPTPRRKISDGTIAERQAFQKDLEQRQRAIQEALKSKMEGSARSCSPTPSVTGPMKAFSMLRANPSRDTVASRTNGGPSRAINILGIGTNASSASLQRTTDEHLKIQKQNLANGSSHPCDYRKESEGFTARSAGGNPWLVKGRSPPSMSTNRVRSNSQLSTASGRSGSRTDHADRTEQALSSMPPQAMISGMATPESSPSPLPGVEPQANASMLRPRSGSRSSASSHFDPKPVHLVHPNAGRHGIPRFSTLPPSATSSTSSAARLGRNRITPGATKSADHSPAISPLPAMPAGLSAHSNHSSPAITSTPLTLRAGGGIRFDRKKSVVKSIISEPMFLSSTSVVDTIDLPPGASLKNGMEESPPPIPPINPMRRRFGFGRPNPSNTTDPDCKDSTDGSNTKDRSTLAKNSSPMSDAAVSQTDRAAPMRAVPLVKEGAMF